jgi:hypothetical protein
MANAAPSVGEPVSEIRRLCEESALIVICDLVRLFRHRSGICYIVVTASGHDGFVIAGDRAAAIETDMAHLGHDIAALPALPTCATNCAHPRLRSCLQSHAWHDAVSLRLSKPIHHKTER